MTMNDLRHIIKSHGVFEMDGCHVIDGCEVLEHIVDVGGFVALLRDFKRSDQQRPIYSPFLSFISDYPDPVEFILGGGVLFSTDDFKVGIYVINDHYYYSDWEYGSIL